MNRDNGAMIRALAQMARHECDSNQLSAADHLRELVQPAKREMDELKMQLSAALARAALAEQETAAIRALSARCDEEYCAVREKTSLLQECVSHGLIERGVARAAAVATLREFAAQAEPRGLLTGSMVAAIARRMAETLEKAP